MGCAIGMSVAAACEIIYWLTLKPVAKLMANVTLTTRAKYVNEKILLIVFLSVQYFCVVVVVLYAAVGNAINVAAKTQCIQVVFLERDGQTLSNFFVS